MKTADRKISSFISHHSSLQFKQRFTLIELLVVIAISVHAAETGSAVTPKINERISSMDVLQNPNITVQKRLPFDQGAPHINGPAVFGLSPEKVCFYAVPVRGERPLKFRVEGKLPSGIQLDPERGILHGKTSEEGDYPLNLVVENRLGKAEKAFTLKVHPNGNGLAPLLGWCSWNAMDKWVTQEKVLKQAHLLKELGLAARGYAYVNIDSGWQGSTRDLKTLALTANEKFPDMAGMVRELHEMGLKAGIYSTPMVLAWGSTPERIFRGSTDYPVDQRYWFPPDAKFHLQGIGKSGNFGGYGRNGREQQDARQWAEWGFDYLKYDWPACDLEHVNRMRDALRATDRDFIYSLTTHCNPDLADKYKEAGHMFRDNSDNYTRWKSIDTNLRTSDRWLPHTGPGGWYDMDMLALGPVHPYVFKEQLTRDELIFCFSAWTMLSCPIQLSCNLEAVDDFTLDLFSHEGLLAVNQDVTGRTVWILNEQRYDNNGKLIREIRVYRKPLADGSAAYGFFNLSGTEQQLEFPLDAELSVHDVLANSQIGKCRCLKMVLPRHGVRILKISL